MDYKIERATQQDINEIVSLLSMDEDILQYMTVGKYLGRFTVPESDWHDQYFVIKTKGFLYISIDRDCDINFDISLYSSSSIASGLLLKHLNKIIKGVKPRTIKTSVHSSNKKSLKLNRKLFGKEYAVRELDYWNIVNGEYEDAYLFRKIMEY